MSLTNSLATVHTILFAVCFGRDSSYILMLVLLRRIIYKFVSEIPIV